MGDKINEILDNLSVRVTIQLDYKGKVLLDEKMAKLLFLIHRKGSILAASKSMGIPYSRAWEWIGKIERLLGSEIVSRRRGGSLKGGTSLTKIGKILLDFYLKKAREFNINTLIEHNQMLKYVVADLSFAGSHDPILEKIFEKFEQKTGYDVDVSWVGSTGGLLAIISGEADIAGCHLFDPKSGEYNLPYVKKYWLDNKVVVIRGYMREISLAYRPDKKIEEIEELLNGGIRLVNRNPGSGTRILLDQIINEIARKKGRNPLELIKKIQGYEFEVRTHLDVAKAIAVGKADAGLLLTYIAKKYGLESIPIKWEFYDFIIPFDRLKNETIRKFLKFLKSNETKNLIKKCDGYKLLKSTGEIIYTPKKL